MAPGLLEAHPDIGLYLLQHVAQVQGAVGIGQGTGNQDLALDAWAAMVREFRVCQKRGATIAFLVVSFSPLSL